MWSEGAPPRPHRATVRWPPIAPAGCTGPGWTAPCAPESTQGRAPRVHSPLHAPQPRATNIPGDRPHCCGGSSRSGRLAGSPARLQTLETPCRQTRCPHCSHPTSSPRPGSPGGGCCSHRWPRSPRHTSVSRRRPPRQRQWRAQRRTPGWLWREATGLAGPGSGWGGGAWPGASRPLAGLGLRPWDGRGSQTQSLEWPGRAVEERGAEDPRRRPNIRRKYLEGQPAQGAALDITPHEEPQGPLQSEGQILASAGQDGQNRNPERYWGQGNWCCPLQSGLTAS